jgi:gliding motility-associated-like protein
LGGETTSGLSGQATGSYSVTVSDGNGCTVSETATIALNGSLPVTIDPAYSEIDLGSSVQLSLTSAGTISWTPSNTLSCSDCANPTATPSVTTTYIANVTDANGCVGSDSVVVVIKMLCGELYVPNIFSPNGTGPQENNVFKVFGTPACVTDFQFEVFDRWGEMVFGTETFTDGWDGKYKNQDVNTGIYVYRMYAMLIDGTVVETSGNVTLVR